jgi:hypothetical protein
LVSGQTRISRSFGSTLPAGRSGVLMDHVLMGLMPFRPLS